MTVIVALENIDNLDQKVVVSPDSFIGLDGYSKMGLKVGDVLSYRDLLYGIMLPSGADAANALIIDLVGSVDKFVSMMNDKAFEIL